MVEVMSRVSARTLLGELARLAGSTLIVTGGLAAYLCYGYAVGQGPDLDGAMLYGWLKGLASAAVFMGGDWPVVWLPAVLLYITTAIWRYSRLKRLKKYA